MILFLVHVRLLQLAVAIHLVSPQALDDWTHFFFFFFFFLHFHPFGDPYDMFMQLFYL